MDNQDVINILVEEILMDGVNGDTTVINEILSRVPFEVIKNSLSDKVIDHINELNRMDINEIKDQVKDGSIELTDPIPTTVGSEEGSILKLKERGVVFYNLTPEIPLVQVPYEDLDRDTLIDIVITLKYQ